ncbi:MAG TPA: hypothetical protein VFV50_07700 [Bdellovibrionales bacterium]|nr:hypothetical protein [Bdellovibrionales bacterium]
MRQVIRLTIGFLALSLSLSSLLAPLRASAQTQGSNDGGYVPPTQNVPTTRNASMTNSSKKAAIVYLGGAAGATAAAIAFQRMCNPPAVTWPCPLAGLSAGQAAQFARDGIGSLRSRSTAGCEGMAQCGNNLNGFGGLGGLNGLGGGDGNGGGGPGDFGQTNFDWRPDPNSPLDSETTRTLSGLNQAGRSAKTVERDLAGKGYTYDPETGTVTTPSGKSVSGSDYASPSAMAAAGLTPREIAEATRILKTTGARSADVAYAGGGGGAGRAVAGGDVKPFDLNAYMRGMQVQKRGPASLDGMKKLVGGEPIGLAVDNIFDMVSRRYKSQAGQGAFLP